MQYVVYSSMTQFISAEGQFQLVYGCPVSRFRTPKRRHFKLPHADSGPIFSKLIASDTFVYVLQSSGRRQLDAESEFRWISFIRSTDANRAIRSLHHYFLRVPVSLWRRRACRGNTRGDYRASVAIFTSDCVRCGSHPRWNACLEETCTQRTKIEMTCVSIVRKQKIIRPAIDILSRSAHTHSDGRIDSVVRATLTNSDSWIFAAQTGFRLIIGGAAV